MENQNKEVRRYIPKGTDLSTVFSEQLERVAMLLNAKPRNCLNGLSSGDVWLLESRRVRAELH